MGPGKYRKPLPKPNPDDRAFWEGCREHVLRFQKCADCGQVRWPPGMLCPNCYSANTGWITSGGAGTVYTFAVYHQAFEPSFEEELPYVTAVIALAEGPHLLSNIVNSAPEEIQCGDNVTVVWDEVSDDFTLPKFQITGR